MPRNYLLKTVEAQARLSKRDTPRKRAAFKAWRTSNPAAANPYLVIYTHPTTGKPAAFGYSPDSNGGSAMVYARLLDWVKDPKVISAGLWNLCA